MTAGPSSVIGGGKSQATVTLTAPAPDGGAIVAISSSNGTIAPIPATVKFPAGIKIVTFSIETKAVTEPVQITITASLGGASRKAILKVTKN